MWYNAEITPLNICDEITYIPSSLLQGNSFYWILYLNNNHFEEISLSAPMLLYYSW